MNVNSLAADSPGARLARSLALVTRLDHSAKGSLDALDRLLSCYQNSLATNRDPDLNRRQRKILSNFHNDHLTARVQACNELSYIDSLITAEMAHVKDQMNQLKRLQTVHRTGQGLSWDQMNLPPSRRLRSREIMTTNNTVSFTQRPLSAPVGGAHARSVDMSIPKSTTNGSVVEIPVSQNQASKSLNKHNDSNILSLTSKQLQKQKQRQRQRQKLRSKQLRNKDASNQPLTLKFNVSSNLTSDPVNTGISAPKVSAPKKASSVSHIKPKPKNKTYPSEETYCTCHRPSFGKMIACDDPKCPIEWYHLSCLSIKSAPKGKWICPTCTKRNEAKKNHKKRVT